MKKVIALILCLVSVIGMLSAVSASGDNETISYEASVMRGLHVLDESDVNNPGEEVTRGEFVRILMEMIEAPFSAVSGESTFPDLKSGKTYTEAVIYALDSGYIKGYGDGKFYPEKTITVQEAANVILNVSGYGVPANTTGNYLLIAQSEGLFDGITTGAESALTYENLAKILYNTLTVELMSTVYTGNGTGLEKSDVLFMEKYMKLVRYRGIVTATYFTSLDGEQGCGEDNVAIGGMVIGSNYEKINNYLGYNVEAYSKQISGGVEEVVFALPYKTNVTEINGEDITNNVTEISLRYQKETDSSEKSIKISPSACKILNNVSSPEYNMDELVGDADTVVLVDNNNDKIADVVFAYKYKQMYVSGISVKDEEIYGKYSFDGAITKLELENADKLTVTRNGQEALFSEITDNDVITIFDTTSDGVREVTIEISSKKVNGVVTGLNRAEDLVYIDNVEYRKSKLYKAAVSKNDIKAKDVEVGMTAVFYLDSNDKIVALEQVSGVKKYGYYKKFYVNEDVENDISIKILGEDGDWQLYKLRSKVNTDGIVLPSAKVVSEVGKVPQIITFELDGEGFVKSIDRAELSNDYTRDDLCYREINMQTYRRANQSFDSKVYVSGETVNYSIPTLYTNEKGTSSRYTDEEISQVDDKYFSVERGSIYSDWKAYTLKAYDVNEFGEARIITLDTTIENVGQFDTGNFLFSKSKYVISSDGTEQMAIEGLHGTNISATAYVALDVMVFDENGNRVTTDYFGRGDLLKLYFDIDDEVYRIDVVYKAEPGKMSKYNDSLHDEVVVLSGNVVNIDKEKGYIILDDGLSEYKTQKVFTDMISVYICDMESQNAIEVGNISNITVGDYIIMKGGQSTFDFIVIYE